MHILCVWWLCLFFPMSVFCLYVECLCICVFYGHRCTCGDGGQSQVSPLVLSAFSDRFLIGLAIDHTYPKQTGSWGFRELPASACYPANVCHHTWLFMWVRGTGTRAWMFARQGFYWLSDLTNHLFVSLGTIFFNFIKGHNMCECECMCECVGMRLSTLISASYLRDWFLKPDSHHL